MFLRKIMCALERIEENQRLILDRLAAPEGKCAQTEKPPDEWIQQAIDNILSYEAGKKRGDSQ